MVEQGEKRVRKHPGLHAEREIGVEGSKPEEHDAIRLRRFVPPRIVPQQLLCKNKSRANASPLDS